MKSKSARIPNIANGLQRRSYRLLKGQIIVVSTPEGLSEVAVTLADNGRDLLAHNFTGMGDTQIMEVKHI